MDCPVCVHPWDLQDRRPKALPCLHSLCRSCLARLNDRRCPTCRKAFTEPVSDNFALVACLEAMNLESPRVTWWCMDCQSTASADCVDEHDVRRPKAALRRGLQDWMPAAMQDLQGLQDGLQGLQDSAALTALRLLRGVPATFKVSLRQDDGEAFGAEGRVDGQAHSKDSLLKTLFVALAASGRLKQEPREVQQDAAPAEQQPAQRIGELNMGDLISAGPNVKAERLNHVRQYGVRRMTALICNLDPAWALDVLRSAAPTLEELQVNNPSEEHLVVITICRDYDGWPCILITKSCSPTHPCFPRCRSPAACGGCS